MCGKLVLFSFDYCYLRLPGFAVRRCIRGNSGGHLSFASLHVLASLLVIPRRSISDSVRGTILQPTVLNNPTALFVNFDRNWWSTFEVSFVYLELGD